MDFQDKTKKDGSIFGDKPEPIFEDMVSRKLGDAGPVVQAEEVPAEITSAQDVDRPAPEVLQYVPSTAHEKKYRLFFIGATAVFFCIVLVVLVAIMRSGPKPVKSPVPTTITYWGLWEDEKVLKPVFDAYTKANPHVTIVYEKRDPNGYLTWLHGRATHDKGPDIFRYHNTWLPQLTNLALVAPIPSEVMTNDQFEKTFHKIHQQDLKIKDQYFGMPLYVDGLVMLYNPDLLRAAGVPSAPTLFAGDLIDVVRQVTVKGQNGPLTAGIALGTTGNVEHYSDIFAMIFLLNVLENQSDLSNAWARGILTRIGSDQSISARGGEAVQIYREFAESGYWGENMVGSVDAFAQGKVAMIFAPTWEIPVIRAKNPDFKFSVAKVPEGLQGRRVSIANYWVEGVSKYSKNQVESWKLLKYMTEVKSLEMLFASQVQNRGMGMAYPRIDMRDMLSDHPDLAPLMGELDTMVSVPFIARTYDQGVNDEIVGYIGQSIDSASRGVAYSAAFQDAARGIAQVVSKYKIE